MLPKEISKKKEVGVGRIDEEGSEGSPHFWAIREGSIALKKVGWEEPQQMSQNFAGLVLYRGLGLVETERERGGGERSGKCIERDHFSEEEEQDR